MDRREPNYWLHFRGGGSGLGGASGTPSQSEPSALSLVYNYVPHSSPPIPSLWFFCLHAFVRRSSYWCRPDYACPQQFPFWRYTLNLFLALTLRYRRNMDSDVHFTTSIIQEPRGRHGANIVVLSQTTQGILLCDYKRKYGAYMDTGYVGQTLLSCNISLCLLWLIGRRYRRIDVTAAYSQTLETVHGTRSTFGFPRFSPPRK